MIRIAGIVILSGFLFLINIIFIANAQSVNARETFGINDNWKFNLGGKEYADNIDFNDTNWQNVNLPHTWNAQDPFDDDETYTRGIGWYRKFIEFDKNLLNKKIYLFFEGANQVTDVYVNGAFAGRHKGGYTAFAFDVRLNDETLINNLDLTASYGFAEAVVKSFVVKAKDSRSININFNVRKGSAILSGVKIEKVVQ